MYVLDGTLVHSNLQTKYLPSQLAAASLFIARTSRAFVSSWSSCLMKYTNYHTNDLQPICKEILKAKKMDVLPNLLVANNNNRPLFSTTSRKQQLDWVEKKYNSKEYDYISNLELTC